MSDIRTGNTGKRYRVTAIMPPHPDRAQMVISNDVDPYATDSLEAAERVLAEIAKLAPAYLAPRIETEEVATHLAAPLVERVAKAISTKCYALIDGSEDCGDWEEMSDEARGIYREAALAALAALQSASTANLGPTSHEAASKTGDA